MAETKQQTIGYPKVETTDAWPYWQVAGPPAPCTCGGCKFERLQGGRAWRCEECQVVIRRGDPVAKLCS